MQSQTFKRLHLALVTLTLALIIASPRQSSAQEQNDGGGRALQGTWWVQVTTLRDCASRTPLLTFSALLTFAGGGTMTGTTTNPGFAVGQRSTDHGVWARRPGSHAFQASSVALVLFSTPPNFPQTPGFQVGSQRLDQTITLTDRDHFTSDAVTAFFDAAGQKYRQGCATALGERFK